MAVQQQLKLGKVFGGQNSHGGVAFSIGCTARDRRTVLALAQTVVETPWLLEQEGSAAASARQTLFDGDELAAAMSDCGVE
jgi:hypothetical protein